VAVVGSHLEGAGAAGASVWHGGVSGMEGINGLLAGYFGQQNVAVVDGLIAVGVALVVARFAWVAVHSRISLRDAGGRWVVIAGIAAALLTDLHLYPQDCVLVLIALPLLFESVPPALRLPVVLATALFLDASWLDQLAVTPHAFTWLLAIAFAWACARGSGVNAPVSQVLARVRHLSRPARVTGHASG
jgi:hypothetical protein